MLSIELLAGIVVLLAAVSVGIVVHEAAHAAVLRLAGVPFQIRWLPGATRDRFAAGLTGTLASVHMETIPAGLAPWKLRAASLAPLVLLVPLLPMAAGIVADPFAGDDVLVQLAVVGWIACALPSPQDFSLVWYAEEVIADEGV